jgi:hypothetical protein
MAAGSPLVMLSGEYQIKLEKLASSHLEATPILSIIAIVKAGSYRDQVSQGISSHGGHNLSDIFLYIFFML